MTQFRIERDGLTIGYEDHTKEGIYHRYTHGFISRDDLLGFFPVQPGDQKILTTPMIEFDIQRFDEKAKSLKEKKAKVELKQKREKRTLSQNAYLHVCISMFAIHVGETLRRTKTDLKRESGFMVEEYKGKKYLRSSTELDTKEMTLWIDWIRNYAAMNEIFIPSPDDYRRNWVEYERQVEACKPYL
jgi:hypothetical protein